MANININWTTVRKVAKGTALIATAAMLVDYIIAKTRYYKKAEKVMDKTEAYMDKTMKLVEDTLD